MRRKPRWCESTSASSVVAVPSTATSTAMPTTDPIWRAVLLIAPPIDSRSGGSVETAAAEFTGMNAAMPTAESSPIATNSQGEGSASSTNELMAIATATRPGPTMTKGRKPCRAASLPESGARTATVKGANALRRPACRTV